MNLKKYRRIKLFNIRGIPVYLGWSLYPIVVFVFLGMFTDISLLVGALCWWGVMMLHELGHAWQAIRYKLRVYEIQLNLVHGTCEYEASSVPYVNYVVAWGGVLIQILIGIPCVLLLVSAGSELPWYLATPVVILGPISLMVAAVNLAPSKGLDGYTCWKAIPLYFKYRKPRKKKNPFKIVK